MISTYARFELVRMFRNARFFILSLVFPVVMFFLIAGPNRHARVQGIALPVYYLAGMAAWGTMSAVIAGGARIAAERAVGWNRQLRTTPLSVRTYFGTKVAAGYVMALVSMALVDAAGVALGVRLPLVHWLVMSGLLLAGLVPFAAMGVLLGHVLSVDAMGPAMGGITALFAIFGGSWGPLATSGGLHDFAELLPSYWLVQAGRAAVDGGAWPAKGWVVIAVWTALLTRLAAKAYLRDTGRV